MMQNVVFIAGIIGIAASAYWLGYCQGKRHMAREVQKLADALRRRA